MAQTIQLCTIVTGSNAALATAFGNLNTAIGGITTAPDYRGFTTFPQLIGPVAQSNDAAAGLFNLAAAVQYLTTSALPNPTTGGNNYKQQSFSVSAATVAAAATAVNAFINSIAVGQNSLGQYAAPTIQGGVYLYQNTGATPVTMTTFVSYIG